MLHVIGTIELRETTSFDDRSFETASRWERVECQSQTVALVYDDTASRYVRAHFSGVVVDGYAANSLGSYSSAVPRERFVGRERTYTLDSYAYNLHKLMEDDRFVITLAPGVEHSVESVLMEKGSERERIAHFSRIAPAPRRYERRFLEGGRDSTYGIIDTATGETVETITEPNYQQGRQSAARIVELEFEALTR